MISGAGYRAAADVAEVIDQAGDVMKRAEAAAMEALTTVQDYVAETSGAPWPGEGTQMPLARCRVTENEIEMWFQDDSGRRVLEVPTVNW